MFSSSSWTRKHITLLYIKNKISSKKEKEIQKDIKTYCKISKCGEIKCKSSDIDKSKGYSSAYFKETSIVSITQQGLADFIKQRHPDVIISNDHGGAHVNVKGEHEKWLKSNPILRLDKVKCT